jgi:DNA topoisomerase IB
MIFAMRRSFTRRDCLPLLPMKWKRLTSVAGASPGMQQKVKEHMRCAAARKVLATVVHLLETTLIRVGNDEYAARNNGYGLMTLKNWQATVILRLRNGTQNPQALSLSSTFS